MASPRSNKTKLEIAVPAGETSTPRSGGTMMRKPGKRTRNPYLNFLRDFRQQNYHLSVVEVVRQGAEQWRHMTDEQKLPYVKVAFYTPLKRRRCPSCAARTGRMRQSATKSQQRRRKPTNAIRMKRESQSNGGRK